MTLTGVRIIALDNSASEKLPVDGLFSERLTEAIASSGLSGKVIAERAGIDAGYLSNLKGGKRPMPSVPVIKALSDALEVRVDWLASGELPMRHSSSVGKPVADYLSKRSELTQATPRGGLTLPMGVSSPPRSETPLCVLNEIRSEIIRCIETGAPPPPRLLPLIGQIEAIVVELGTKRKS